MDHDVTIIQAKIEDAALLTTLGRQAFRDAFTSETPSADLEAHLEKTYATQRLETELSEPGTVYFIATVRGEPTGFAKLYKGHAPDCIARLPSLELARLYTLKPWWGSGVGAGLMAACLERAHQGRYASIWLSSWKLNDRANAFYRKWGFKIAGETTFTVGSDVQEDYVFVRDL
jgi:GNAT superfamily N-acetyltransferase